ncbi:ABC transporter permease [Frankia nepalensis]|uniref:ABC transporter permease n=1 Tax=Frankia nepalensis TaxID=1836974 RepID=A0A937RSU7_9ACTN|nr:ABC transporter permease [Frankia nepalensis]MBL7501121.1 ABC transporter permease [Frankia nepalensis]MBL7515075.1 ABC transporter permease [Frankia nepalensis]MBL7631301.1 ABC transporter permease [Frankia nepalensis]
MTTVQDQGLVSAPAATGTARRLGALGGLAYRYGLLAVLLGLLVVFSLARSRFHTWDNTLIILQSVSIVAVVALGVTVSMTVGGFDLSVGANVGFVVMVTAQVMVRYNLTGATAILAGLAAGLLVAAVNTLLIVVARVPDLVASLGTMFAFQGLALIITSGQSVSVGMDLGGGRVAPGRYDPDFLWFGTAKVLSIPVAVLVMIVIAAVVIVFLTYSRWGRALYAIGGNPVAARLAGIPVNRYRALAYVISGLCAACAGILLSARLGRGDVGAGDVYLLQAVAATLIGFAVLGANRPNPFGTLVGAVFLGVLINGLTMLNVPYYTQTFVQGALLVAALLLSYAVAPRSRRAS